MNDYLSFTQFVEIHIKVRIIISTVDVRTPANILK